MKVCFLVYDIFTLGGIQRVVSVLANSLSEEMDIEILCINKECNVDRSKYNLNEKVKVIVNKGELDRKLIDKIGYKFAREFMKRTSIDNNSISKDVFDKLYFSSDIQKKFINYFNSNKYDIIIGVAGYYSALLGKISTQLKAKTVGWQHNSYDAYFETEREYHWNEKWLYKRYLKNLDRYIVLTDKDKNIMQLEFNLNNIIRIYNPLSFKSDEKAKLNSRIILSVGRLDINQKGFDLLLEAFSIVNKYNKEWKLKIVGDGPDKKRIREITSELNLSQSVIIKEYTKDIKKEYLNADIFVSSSRWEGFGLVITEAMECGLPIVAFNNSGPSEILSTFKCGILIPKKDTKKMAEDINKLLKDKDKLNKLSQESIKRAKDFSIEIISREWVELLNQIIMNGGEKNCL